MMQLISYMCQTHAGQIIVMSIRTHLNKALNGCYVVTIFIAWQIAYKSVPPEKTPYSHLLIKSLGAIRDEQIILCIKTDCTRTYASHLT